MSRSRGAGCHAGPEPGAVSLTAGREVSRMCARVVLRVSLLASLCVISGSIMTSPASGADSVALTKHRIGGASLYLVTVDLNDPRIRMDVCAAAGGIPRSESFASMIRRRLPVAAVTGTYFDTRTLYPVGTVVSGGRVLHESAIGTSIRFLRSGSELAASDPTGVTRGALYQVSFTTLKKGQRHDMGGADCGLRTGPRLLEGGRCALNPYPEGFRSPGIFGSHTRMALGVTRFNKLLLVAVRTPVTFARLAAIMRKLGAMDAVCLDGGSSSAMYYRGRIVCYPGRALTNIIEVRIEQRARAPVAETPRRAPVLGAATTPRQAQIEVSAASSVRYALAPDGQEVILQPPTPRVEQPRSARSARSAAGLRLWALSESR